MPLMSTCLGRLGSRYNLILDPIRKEIHYGALGLMCQDKAQLVVGIDDGAGHFCTFPLSHSGEGFFIVDQQQTMTAVRYEGYCLPSGVKVQMEIVAPFWPQDEKTSIVPAYVVNIRVEHLKRVRWDKVAADARRQGKVVFGLQVEGASITAKSQRLYLSYPVLAGLRGFPDFAESKTRKNPREGEAQDVVFPISGQWTIREGQFEAAFDVTEENAAADFSIGLAGYCGNALFERFGQAMPLKYTKHWKNADDVAQFVKGNLKALLAKSRRFDEIWQNSSLPASAADLTALSFQTYLINTLWAAGQSKGQSDWFSVWEGSCRFNSTVDVTYNEAMLYFSCWPELLEMIFEQWSQHANDPAAETARLRSHPKTADAPQQEFAGRILEHDMGVGWTANGQSYPHAMPVEENSNFLLLLYSHGQWWGRQELFTRYNDLNKQLVEYLLWADSKGNGFPDRGTANTIDDATPAVQYGRDNVYLGIKRLAALHAASRMFDAVGEAKWSSRCKQQVRKAVKTLNAGWLGDHWGVCLDKSAKGLVDCWTHEKLPYKTLPGWDAYSLYTTNGLLCLMMVDDLPPGLSTQRLRLDVTNACRESMTTYGCGHSSLDKKNMWVSMNVWRDLAAGYLGQNLVTNCERYWNQQLFGNGIGSEKPNCFTETSLTNNLVHYPRGAACFGLPLAMAGLTLNEAEDAGVAPAAPGKYPLLPMANWKTGAVPYLVAEMDSQGKMKARIEMA